jgi:hypothetical protein
MTTLQLNAEIYEALSIIAQDESLLKKAARSLKRLDSMKKDETLMSQEEFFATVDQSLQDANQGRIKKVSSEGELVSFLNSLCTHWNLRVLHSNKVLGLLVMATIVLDITDDKLVMQIKKVCSMIKGVCKVKVVQNKDVTKTRGYQEAMDDIKAGRIYHAESADDMFKQILR